MIRDKILPDCIEQKPKRSPSLSIWSAGCSTGQEVYSIAIFLKNFLPDIHKWKIRILGTDISDMAIRRASYGRYNKLEITRGLSSKAIAEYFDHKKDYWQIKDEIRAMVSFQKRNLLEEPSDREKFDIVFCRYVAIYFDSKKPGNITRKYCPKLIYKGLFDLRSDRIFTQSSDFL